MTNEYGWWCRWIIYSNRNQEMNVRGRFTLPNHCSICSSNRNQECHLDETIVYYLNKDFTIRQFVDEFGEGSEFPQIAIGYKHIGSLKDTLHYMSEKGMFV